MQQFEYSFQRDLKKAQRHPFNLMENKKGGRWRSFLFGRLYVRVLKNARAAKSNTTAKGGETE